MQSEAEMLRRLRENDHATFSSLFCAWYKDLVLFACSIISDRTEAEDIVQNVFLKLWAVRNDLTVKTSLRQYLISSVRNQCFDSLRRRKVNDAYTAFRIRYGGPPASDCPILHSELSRVLEQSISNLPPEERVPFEMSRMENIKYKDIARHLGVSVRTVETRIAKALKRLRGDMCDYLECPIPVKR